MGFSFRTFYRVTNHANPRYQLYQPGFNDKNSCWLEGDWITVPKAGWRKRKADHQRLYACIYRHHRLQNHRDKGTPVSRMTNAERQAWEHYQGNFILSGRANGHFAAASIAFGGNAPQPKQITWLRKKGYVFPQWVKAGPTGEPRNQLRGLKLPDDLVDKNTPEIAYDELTATVEQNRKRSEELFEASLRGMDPAAAEGKVVGRNFNFTQFSAMMAFNHLLEQEETIVRGEWEASRGKDRPIPFEPEKERQLYVEIRKKLKAAVTNFDEWYKQTKAEHNSCERHNLDNSEGLFFCFVLPEFHDDGSHEPVGEHDVPWGNA
jgi:hypothetical protein